MKLLHKLFCLLALVLPAALAEAQSIRTVQNLGSSQGSTPTINNSGEVSYTAKITGPAMSEPGGILSVAIATGDQAPGLASGTTVSSLGNVHPDSGGRAGFSAFLTGGGVTSANNYAIWSLNQGAPTVAMRLGDQAPGNAAGVTYQSQSNSSPGAFSYNPRGDVTFDAYVTGPGIASTNNQGVWTSQGGSTTLLAQIGNQAAGMPTGMLYSSFINGGTTNAPLNGNGQSLISAGAIGPGGEASVGVWLGGPGGMNLIAQRGDPAPGLPDNTFRTFRESNINNSNHVALLGVTTGPEGTSVGVWSGSPGNLSLLVASAQPAQAAGPGISFNQMGSPAISGTDKVAFVTTLTGSGVTTTNDSSVWTYDGSGLKMLVREGMQAPGLPIGDKMGSVLFSNEVGYGINSEGRVALSAVYVDPSNGHHRALWESSPGGNLDLVLTEGQSMLVDGQMKTIKFLFTQLGETGLQDGQFTGFNERGQIAFEAGFTDGTWGEFVYTPAAVPEPSTFVLALIRLAVAAIWGSRRWIASVGGGSAHRPRLSGERLTDKGQYGTFDLLRGRAPASPTIWARSCVNWRRARAASGAAPTSQTLVPARFLGSCI